MNLIQTRLLMQALFANYTAYTKNAVKAEKLKQKAQEFLASVTPEGMPVGDWDLDEKDEKKYREMRSKARKLTDPIILFQKIADELDGILSDKKLYEIEYDMESSIQREDIVVWLKQTAKEFEIVSTKYFTGIHEGKLMYCCAVELLPKVDGNSKS